MIVLYTGTPGSGKSAHAANDIRLALNKISGDDRPVIANFEVNVSKVKRPNAFTYIPNSALTPDLLTTFAKSFWSERKHIIEDYILIVIDECQLVFNSRDWQNKGRAGKHDSRMDWLEFLSQHRKYGFKVILIAQSAKMIDNQFRMLTEYEVNHRKVANIGMIGSIIGALFGGRLFVRNKYLFQTGEKLGYGFALLHNADMQLYDTLALHEQVV